MSENPALVAQVCARRHGKESPGDHVARVSQPGGRIRPEIAHGHHQSGNQVPDRSGQDFQRFPGEHATRVFEDFSDINHQASAGFQVTGIEQIPGPDVGVGFGGDPARVGEDAPGTDGQVPFGQDIARVGQVGRCTHGSRTAGMEQAFIPDRGPAVYGQPGSARHFARIDHIIRDIGRKRSTAVQQTDVFQQRPGLQGQILSGQHLSGCVVEQSPSKAQFSIGATRQDTVVVDISRQFRQEASLRQDLACVPQIPGKNETHVAASSDLARIPSLVRDIEDQIPDAQDRTRIVHE